MDMRNVIRRIGMRERCPRCAGVGRDGVGMKRYPCERCGGSGKILSVPPFDEYVAVIGEDVVDRGGPLASFVADLLLTCQLLSGDCTVSRLDAEQGPRVVCIITKGADGDAEARWL